MAGASTTISAVRDTLRAELEAALREARAREASGYYSELRDRQSGGREEGRSARESSESANILDQSKDGATRKDTHVLPSSSFSSVGVRPATRGSTNHGPKRFW